MTKRSAAILNISSPKLEFISKKEWDEIAAKAIPKSEWHFERCEPRGVKPVKGKYDPTNPTHIKVDDIIHIAEF
ncbi:MAG: hypothetical protein MUF59_06515 [Candidatus Krumholzibacteria bacterium]|nr:hypothetical protein [Candidatus Krumholzibacteria bacterium]